MKRLSAALLLLGMVWALASCSKPPLYSSDAEFAEFVKAEYAAEHPDSPLSDLQVKPLVSAEDLDKREFTAKTGDVKVKGFMSYDKKSNKSSYKIEYEYPD